MATDSLSDILKTVRISGSVFYDVTARAPWVIEQLSSQAVVQMALPGADHIIAYHIVTDGRCFASMIGTDTPVELRAGQVIVFTQADPHTLSSSPGVCGELVPSDVLAGASIEQQPFSIKMGNEVPVTARLTCGFLAYNGSPFNPLLDNLPPVLIADCSRDGDMPWLGELISLALREARNRRTGSESVLNRLTELMLIEVIRQYLDRLSPKPEGWLAGLMDPLVGRALSLMHECPKCEWGLAKLAQEVGLSRSEFAKRFACLVGDPPMQYLAKWRMQVATALLNDNVKIATVATEVGYSSDSSFSRAFKKVVGVPPSLWRVRRDEGETAAGAPDKQDWRSTSYSERAPLTA